MSIRAIDEIFSEGLGVWENEGFEVLVPHLPPLHPPTLTPPRDVYDELTQVIKIPQK